MNWVFILLDVLILFTVIVLCGVIVFLWNKKRSLSRNSLELFRNDEIYEKSKEEQKRMAHIDDTVIEENEYVIPPEPESVEDAQIVFSGGYGGKTQPGVQDND